jgi:hypothetical protein
MFPSDSGKDETHGTQASGHQGEFHCAWRFHPQVIGLQEQVAGGELTDSFCYV